MFTPHMDSVSFERLSLKRATFMETTPSQIL
ncbi:hypothetical protein L915_01369 [Phytophthora nicotianae]|uniref:Uncharacterized protein n=1 Tax=Phytophthora nicotianae TaxID=4792 RepID=W2HKB3_PHYNI|nr:hypothetical protein L915_01369 [Phytophthora nicotianae]